MQGPLRVLLLEDRSTDAELILHELRRAGFATYSRRVESEHEFVECLSDPYDLILSDFRLPGFTALQALRHVQRQCPEVPVIVITGTLSDEDAVACMKHGAADYLLKDRMARLGQAVQRVLEEARERVHRQHTEKTLRRNEELFRLIMENMSDLVAVLDVEGKRLYNSPSYKTVLGDQEALRGTDSFSDVHPEDRESVRQTFFETIATGVGKRTEFRFLLKDGSIRHVESQGSVIRDDHGATSQVIVVSRDITARKQAEEALQKTEGQLRQAQKVEAIGLLAGGIAHDFNNLLTVINGYSELALQRLPAQTSNRHEIEAINEAGKRAALLTQQILAFSHQQVLTPQIVDLNIVIQNTWNLLKRLIGEDITVDTRYEPALKRVKVDPGQLEQVIMNLAVNARDAMPTGGMLTFETANVELPADAQSSGPMVVPPGAYVMMTVRDTGIGMDAATQARIFDPFFTTKEQGKGTGLGLSTVYGIVKQSDGHILIDSQPGRGTTFSVYFPQAHEKPAPAPAVPEPVSASGGNESVLLIEDEEAVRSYIRTVLKKQGYVVLETTHGDEALLFSARYDGPIHLLLTDVIMPGQSGPQVAERLLAARPNMKVLYLSGYTEREMGRGGSPLSTGAAFLPKPFSPEALVRKIRDVLRSHGAASS